MYLFLGHRHGNLRLCSSLGLFYTILLVPDAVEERRIK